jgi:hypothetical protein
VFTLSADGACTEAHTARESSGTGVSRGVSQMQSLNLPTRPARFLALVAGLCLLPFASTQAMASIAPGDASAIGSAVTTAITGAAPGGQSAITDAIKTAAETELKQYGPDNAKEVAADIIADALAGGATPQELGEALAEASLELGPPFSTDNADAVACAKDSETLGAFDVAVSGSPGGQQLAAEADAEAAKCALRGGGPLATGSVEPGGSVTGTGKEENGSGCVDVSCT